MKPVYTILIYPQSYTQVYTHIVDKYVTKNMDQSGDKWSEMDNG